MKITISEEQKALLTEKIRIYFLNERDEALGDLACLLILEFIVDELGPIFYNMGVKDAAKFIDEKIQDLYEIEV